jgi:hypothetical protein
MGGNAMNDDGHFIDDPLMIVNVKPDFSGMGIPTEHHPGEPLTLQYFIGKMPDWIKILPKDWKGETTRANIHLAVSNLAIENAKFDLMAFVSTKFKSALNTIRKKHEKSELCLTQRFTLTVDTMQAADKTFLFFHIEFEK